MEGLWQSLPSLSFCPLGMVEHSSNHLPLCGIHESGRWWDLTSWSCAEYWYDPAFLSIRRGAVIVPLIKILFLCFLFLSNAWNAKKYRYENYTNLGTVPKILFTFIHFLRSLWYLYAAMMCSLNVLEFWRNACHPLYAVLYIYVSVWESSVPLSDFYMSVLCAVRNRGMFCLFFSSTKASYKSLSLRRFSSSVEMVRSVPVLH